MENLNPATPPAVSRRQFIRTVALAAAASGLGPVLMSRTAAAAPITASGPAAFRLPLDQNWLFGGKVEAQSREEKFQKVTLPHCVTPLSWENWNPADWESSWVYRRHFTTGPEFKNRRVFLQFGGVMSSAKPVFNEVALPEYIGAYLPFEYEITQWLKAGGNTLDVVVDSRWQDAPPEGNPKGARSVDYLEPGGIPRPVILHVVPQIFISDVFAKPVNVLDASRSIEVTCSIDAGVLPQKPLEVKVVLLEGDRVMATVSKPVFIDEWGVTPVSLKLSDLGEIKLWDIGAPQLYAVHTTLLAGGEPVHDHRTRIGLRRARFDLDGFWLNGRRLRLFGLNRHEVYPYVGAAMPGRVMRRDAEILLHEFNCNIVRCSHYPQSEAFLDACDELGLMIWEETPGWGYLGDEAWKDLVVRDVASMIRRDRNHPSVVIWGVRVNESRNDPALYRRTNEVAKSLDGSRPTSGSMTTGSRTDWQQNWHEDVFAFDDYHSAPDGSVGIDVPVGSVPYMLSEAVGQFSYGLGKNGFHNYYRRAGDLRLQTSQALYHAQAHDRAAKYKDCSGVIGWCGFDYASLLNQYQGVKCPGVADVFRIPKLGAAFYQSQVKAVVRPVIQPSFYWDFGPQSPRGPGAQAAIFSNCERLEVFVAGKLIGKLNPDRAGYPHLEHPPFFCDLDVDGTEKPELRIDGYVGAELVLSKLFSSNVANDQFLLAADDTELNGDGSDATRLVFKVADQYGSERAFGTGTVSFEVNGPGAIVGDNPFALTESGGVGAVWIKATAGGSGPIKVVATHSALGAKSVEIQAIADSSRSDI